MLRVFQGSFKHVAMVFQGIFMVIFFIVFTEGSREFQECLKEVLFGYFVVICCDMAVIATLVEKL